MRNILLGVAALCALLPVPAVAGDWHKIGDFVTYGNVVEKPDYRIQYVAFDPNVATLALQQDPNSRIFVPPVELRPNVPKDIFVKRECPTVITCKSYYVTLSWTRTVDNEINIDYVVKIIPARPGM